jgi:plasmid maintenance system antidote protein VapI
MSKLVDYIRLAYHADDAINEADSASRLPNLKQLIRDAGLTNPELAEKVGCKPVEIWRLATWPDKGGRKITPEWAIKIAPHIGVRPHELVFGMETTNNNYQINALQKENEKLKQIIIDLLG